MVVEGKETSDGNGSGAMEIDNLRGEYVVILAKLMVMKDKVTGKRNRCGVTDIDGMRGHRLYKIYQNKQQHGSKWVMELEAGKY